MTYDERGGWEIIFRIYIPPSKMKHAVARSKQKKEKEKRGKEERREKLFKIKNFQVHFFLTPPPLLLSSKHHIEH
jgi:hypothetical protein